MADFNYEEYLNNFILSKFGYLEGRVIVSNDEEIVASKEWICKAVRKLVGYRRNSYKDQLSRKATAHEIIEHVDPKTGQNIITEQDVLNNIPGVTGLKIGGNKPKEIEIKFDDVRGMDLSLESLDGFKETEKKIIQRRLSELSEDFNLEKSTDKFLAWRVAVCELKIMQLETLVVLNSKEAVNVKAKEQIEVLDGQYKDFCTSLNALKRQRDTVKTKTVDNTGEEYMNTIKSVDEMQAETEKRKLEIQNKKQLKRKRNK